MKPLRLHIARAVCFWIALHPRPLRAQAALLAPPASALSAASTFSQAHPPESARAAEPHLTRQPVPQGRREHQGGRFLTAVALASAGSFVGLVTGAGCGSEYDDENATSLIALGGAGAGAAAGSMVITDNQSGSIFGSLVGIALGALVMREARDADPTARILGASLAHGLVTAAIAMPRRR